MISTVQDQARDDRRKEDNPGCDEFPAFPVALRARYIETPVIPVIPVSLRAR